MAVKSEAVSTADEMRANILWLHQHGAEFSKLEEVLQDYYAFMLSELRALLDPHREETPC